MRRLPITSLIALTVLLQAALGCTATTETTAPSSTSTTTQDQALQGLLVAPADLPAGFEESVEVNDTITRFCATQDAAAGLRATARAVRGMTRTAGGASVIQLVFRFADDDATRFVAQARDALERCHQVPDLTGLAFEYDPLSPELAALVGRAPSGVGRHGINVGSGSLAINVAVMQHADVAQLIAVLGVDLPRAELDTIAAAAFRAALDRV